MRASQIIGSGLVLVAGLGCSSSTTPDTKQTDGGSVEAGPTTTGWRAAVGAGGILVQTFDEKSWETRSVATHDLYAVACVGNLLGWVAGPAGAVAHTTDGGRSWTAEDSHLSAALRAIRFGDVTFGVVAGEGGALASTGDGGRTWIPRPAGTTATLRGVAIAKSAATAFVVGDGGVVLRSTDAGKTFVPSTIAGASDLRAVTTDDSAHLVLTVDASGAVWASTDAGATFHREATAPRPLRAVSMHEHGLTAIAAGDEGVALERAADGTWSPLATGTTATLRAVLVPHDGVVDYFAGDRGTLLARPRGLAVTAIASGTQADLYALEDL